MTLLVIDSVEVATSTVSAVVRVTDVRLIRTSSVDDLGGRTVGLLPGLKRHRCDSGHVRGILSELLDTETPHLLEHVALELMALAGSPRTLSGNTAWDFARDGRGVFHVTLGYDDDLVALGALSEGVEVVEWLIRGKGPKPNVEAIAARLGELRKR